MSEDNEKIIGWGQGPSQPSHYARPKLTSAQRDEIRERHQNGESVRSLALEYQVSTTTIRFYT